MAIMTWEQTHSKGNGKNENRHPNRMDPDCMGCDLYSQGRERSKKWAWRGRGGKGRGD